jgi:5-methylcytosine-specific restriction endonuclease McrA
MKKLQSAARTFPAEPWPAMASILWVDARSTSRFRWDRSHESDRRHLVHEVWPCGWFESPGSSLIGHVDSAKRQWYRRANLRGSPQKADANVIDERNLHTSLNSQVLVLNRLWQAVNICTARRAFALVYAGHAHVVSSDEANNFMTHDFESWRDFSTTAPEHEMVKTISWKIRVPRVIVLLFFDRLPKKEVKFTRHNVFERDKNTCQYCGQAFERNELNLDHVVPRERGGTTTWENVVCSCIPCNTRKGNRLPEAAHMHLIRKPKRPKWRPFVHVTFSAPQHESWRHFVDLAYWNVELSD